MMLQSPSRCPASFSVALALAACSGSGDMSDFDELPDLAPPPSDDELSGGDTPPNASDKTKATVRSLVAMRDQAPGRPGEVFDGITGLVDT